jgi:hypothetical protein
MTTQISFGGFSPRKIFRTPLLLLLCATPLTAFAQAPTSSTPGAVAVPTIAENLSVTPKFGQSRSRWLRIAPNVVNGCAVRQASTRRKLAAESRGLTIGFRF